jgi:hypothetical protein
MSGNLDAVVPTSGLVNGGYYADVFGTGFIAEGSGRVIFSVGNVTWPALNVIYQSLTRVSIVMPAQPAGVAQIRCRLEATSDVLGELDFTYYANAWPRPLSVEPLRVPVFTEAVVTVRGELLDLTNRVAERLGGGQAPYLDRPFTVLGPDQLTYTTARHNRPDRTEVTMWGGPAGYGGTIAGPMIYEPDMPAGRQGTWRIMIAQRGYTSYNPSMLIGEVMDARSRRLERKLNQPARFVFTVDGDSPTARLAHELQHEVLVTRWHEELARDEEMFRGVIVSSQDTLSEQRHTVNFVAQDNLAIARRRPMALASTFTQRDQDDIADSLLNVFLRNFRSSQGTDFAPAATIPYAFARVYPDGSGGRPLSGRLRDRTYPAQTNLYDAIENLANVINGFDFDVRPVPGQVFQVPDQIRIFYPYRGVQREDFSFLYGSTVSALTRSVNSANYGNYARVIGQTDEGQPQLYAEAWTQDANDIVTNPAGFWAMAESMSDVTEVDTLRNRALALLADNSALEPTPDGFGSPVPSYSLSLRPEAYRADLFDVGDIVPLRVRSGRLDVDTYVRVYGIAFAIGDDGEEDVEVDVGRPGPSFLEVLRTTNRRISALERR